LSKNIGDKGTIILDMDLLTFRLKLYASAESTEWIFTNRGISESIGNNSFNLSIQQISTIYLLKKDLQFIKNI